MKTFHLLFLLSAILLWSCNPDDEMVECEPFIDEGTYSASFAIAQLPSDTWNSDIPLVFTNENQDSTLTFIPENKFTFPQDGIVKTACANGDSTTHTYSLNSSNRAFVFNDFRLSISVSSRLAIKSIIETDGSFSNEKINCLVEQLSISISDSSFNGVTSIFQTLNPNSCDGNSISFTNYREEAQVQLNGQTFEDVLVSDDNGINMDNAFTLYFKNGAGFIGFIDREGILWTIQ